MWRISDELARSAKRVKLNIRETPDTTSKVLGLLRTGETLPMVEVIRDQLKQQRWMRVTFGKEVGYCMLEDRGRTLLEKAASTDAGLTVDTASETEEVGYSHVVIASTQMPIQSSPAASRSSVRSDDLSHDDGLQYYFHNIVSPSPAKNLVESGVEDEAILPRSECDDDGPLSSSSFLATVLMLNGYIVGLIVLLLLLFALVVSINLLLVTVLDLGFSPSLDNIILAH